MTGPASQKNRNVPDKKTWNACKFEVTKAGPGVNLPFSVPANRGEHLFLDPGPAQPAWWCFNDLPPNGLIGAAWVQNFELCTKAINQVKTICWTETGSGWFKKLNKQCLSGKSDTTVPKNFQFNLYRVTCWKYNLFNLEDVFFLFEVNVGNHFAVFYINLTFIICFLHNGRVNMFHPAVFVISELSAFRDKGMKDQMLPTSHPKCFNRWIVHYIRIAGLPLKPLIFSNIWGSPIFRTNINGDYFGFQPMFKTQAST